MSNSELSDYERSIDGLEDLVYVLRLYISGMTPNSLRAVENIKRICEEHLKDRYALEIIDLYQQPVRAAEDQIFAAPTLVKLHPLPVKKLIGDLSDVNKVLLALALK